MTQAKKQIELVGVAEIARMAGVKKQQVSNWKRRSKDMPKPLQELDSGPVWLKDEIRDWLVALGYTHLRQR